MSPTDFHTVALEILRNYWRIKAAHALYRSSPFDVSGRLKYVNVPAVGLATGHFKDESTADAILALRDFIVQRLPRDLFLAVIAEFEARLVTRLVSLGLNGDGTLGGLQTKIQSAMAVPAALVDDLNEIRERRNAMIHHADRADAKYQAASAVVAPRANPFVVAVAVGDHIGPSETYLAYAADVLVRYSNSIG